MYLLQNLRLTGNKRQFNLVQVVVGVKASLELESAQCDVIGAAQELIEDVEVTLAARLAHDSRLLEQIVQNQSTDGRALQQRKSNA